MSFHPATLGFVVQDVTRLWRKRYEQRAGRLGFTRSQWQVLVNLAKHEGIHQAGLADILEIEPITLVRILDKLEARGLIERRQHSKDRRVWLLYLTAAAHPSLSLLGGISDATRAEVLAGVSADDQAHLSRILCQIKTNLVEACAMPVDDKEASNG